MTLAYDYSLGASDPTSGIVQRDAHYVLFVRLLISRIAPEGEKERVFGKDHCVVCHWWGEEHLTCGH
jgi:hypothetical protein